MSERPRILGFATGDLLLLLGASAVAIALALPSIERGRIRREADAAAAAVASLRRAAQEIRARDGRWPPGIGSRTLPPRLAVAVGDTAGAAPRPYGLAWRVWEILERPDTVPRDRPMLTATPLPEPEEVPHPAPTVRRLAGIVVRSPDPRILAELLARYASDPAFVRDSTWTLLLSPDRPAP